MGVVGIPYREIQDPGHGFLNSGSVPHPMVKDKRVNVIGSMYFVGNGIFSSAVSVVPRKWKHTSSTRIQGTSSYRSFGFQMRTPLETGKIINTAGNPEGLPLVSGEVIHVTLGDIVSRSLAECLFEGGTEIRIRNAHDRSPHNRLRRLIAKGHVNSGSQSIGCEIRHQRGFQCRSQCYKQTGQPRRGSTSGSEK